jgi:hypothetical protein
MTDQATPQATPEPITPQNVVSTPEPAPAPDASILASRLNSLLQDPEPKSDLEKLQDQIQALNIQTPAPTPAPAKRDTTADEIRELRESQEGLQNELRERVRQQEMTEAGNAVSEWVTSNAEHFPLINEAGYQQVVMQKIENTKNQTGRVIDAAQAGLEVEEELSALIKRCAPKLGFVMRDEQTAARSEEAQISTTTDGMNIAVPPDWKNMTDDEQMAYLVRQAEG